MPESHFCNQLRKPNDKIKSRRPNSKRKTQDELKKYPCTDTGNMERFVDQHQGYLRSLGTIKTWLVWNGTRWKPSDYAEVFNFALKTVQSIKTEIEQAAGLNDAQNLKRWSVTSDSKRS